jgi:hypothetical protein
MKRKLTRELFVGGVALGASFMRAQAATIAGWTFESLTASTTPSATIGPIPAEVGAGTAFGTHASAATVYSTPAGNGSPKSLSSNQWAIGDYYEFRASTVGQTDIVVSYDQTRSGTGPNGWNFQYSTDGTTFTTFAANYTLSGAAFSSGATISGTPGVNFQFDLSAVDALEGLPTAYFRITDSSAAGGTAGTARVDNVFITSGGIPEPAALGLMTAAGAALALKRRRNGRA